VKGDLRILVKPGLKLILFYFRSQKLQMYFHVIILPQRGKVNNIVQSAMQRRNR